MTLPSADICQTTVADPNLVKEIVLIGEVFEDEYFLKLSYPSSFDCMHFTTRHRWISGNLEAWEAILTD